ncbi:hypothetical protein [Paracoccus sp. (in: a-proteobacteria)]|uniref:hypothetical protein n=1 Tax=Paracoccus sp. TaxID=267 RepID=UPI00272B175C|nr:hypothetical protein [Paracoccus sp. (in: a-proteobacteria)]
MIKTLGNLQVQTLPKLTVSQLYPEERKEINLNTCGDPDCGNFGVSPDPMYDQFVGRGAVARRKAAGQKDPRIAAGLGFYTMSSVKDEERISTALNFHNAPAVWSDGRRLVCRHDQGGAQCKVGFTLYSNQHFLDEVERLRDNDGALDGPRCGACGRRYFDAAEEFALNGANGKDPKTARPLGIRVIHKPCKGRKGARFTVSKDHQEQRDREDNIKILKMPVNGASINSIQRVLTCPRTGERAGMSRIYDRIFWLERTLLAFERAQLGNWRKNLERRGVFRRTRVAHDDIVLGINWETSADRRITALNCTASTDIESGYVFRLDVDFDPRVDPVAVFKDAYLDANRNPMNLHGQYQNATQRFVAPLLHYQRPTGRFDEAAFFGACQSSLRLFAVQAEDAFGRAALPPDVQQAVTEARWVADAGELVGEGWFGLSEQRRDSRNTFTGIMARDAYTKAAHLALLKEMLPAGKMTLVSEQEALIARTVPHIFRDEILADRFEWLAIAFDKEATKPKVQHRVGVFRSNFEQFRHSYTGQVVSDWEMLELFIEHSMTPAISSTRGGNAGQRTVLPSSRVRSLSYGSNRRPRSLARHRRSWSSRSFRPDIVRACVRFRSMLIRPSQIFAQPWRAASFERRFNPPARSSMRFARALPSPGALAADQREADPASSAALPTTRGS